MEKNEKKKLRRAEKRRLELERKRKKAKTMMIASVILIAAICGLVYVAVSMNGNEDILVPSEAQPPPSQSQTEVRIPLSEISNAQFYSHQGDGVAIRYFAVKASDGDVRVAFDACDVCYYAKKGYIQIDDVMHCINCGNEYAITGLGSENVYGGCWPSYLPMEIDGDNVVIKISDLEEKAYMF